MKPANRGVRAGWRHPGVRLQLTAWYGAVLIGLVAALGGLVYALLAANLQHEAETQLAGRVAQVAATLNVDESGLNFQDAAIPGELTLVYALGGALLESNSAEYHPARLPAWVAQAGRGPIYAVVTLPSGRWLLSAAPAGAADLPAGVGRLIVGRSRAPLDAVLRQVLAAFAVAGPLLVLFACAGGYFLAGRALAPVEEAFARERRLTADAAHELRTPLAVVQTETSIALARARPPEEYRRVLAVVESETARMGRLVTDLLVLARADAGRHLLDRQAVLLTALCDRVAGQMRPLAAEKGIRLTTRLEAEIAVRGDAPWLTQMLANLVENAVKYTLPGGWIRLTLTAREGQAVVQVEDNGAGIPEDQLGRIFERFYRADASRNRDGETAGFGLGLAICRWVAQAHDGSVEVSSQVGRGACFTVRLPLLPPPS